MNIRNSTVSNEVLSLPDTDWHGKLFAYFYQPPTENFYYNQNISRSCPCSLICGY